SSSRTVPIASWAVLVLGFAVGAFHGGAFPYFWMTLGLFPAVAIGLALGPLIDSYDQPLGRGLLVAAAVLLIVSGVQGALRVNHDTQRVQRDALNFIDTNFN